MQHPVVIIGAGPIGLAAAANAAERGMDFVVLGHRHADSPRGRRGAADRVFAGRALAAAAGRG